MEDGNVSYGEVKMSRLSFGYRGGFGGCWVGLFSSFWRKREEEHRTFYIEGGIGAFRPAKLFAAGTAALPGGCSLRFGEFSSFHAAPYGKRNTGNGKRPPCSLRFGENEAGIVQHRREAIGGRRAFWPAEGSPVAERLDYLGRRGCSLRFGENGGFRPARLFAAGTAALPGWLFTSFWRNPFISTQRPRKTENGKRKTTTLFTSFWQNRRFQTCNASRRRDGCAPRRAVHFVWAESLHFTPSPTENGKPKTENAAPIAISAQSFWCEFVEKWLCCDTFSSIYCDTVSINPGYGKLHQTV